MIIRRGSYVIYGFYVCPMGSTELAALSGFTHIVIHHSIMRTHLSLPRHTVLDMNTNEETKTPGTT
jgi:hypothetical protein